MKYKQRPGIVLTKICDTNILIPTREAYPSCRSVRQLPMIWAATWELLGREKPEENIMRVHKILTGKSEEQILAGLDLFYRQMYEA